MLLLVDGRFRLDLTVSSTVLARQGDYVVWSPGIDHSWQAEADSVVVTIRWPSVRRWPILAALLDAVLGA